MASADGVLVLLGHEHAGEEARMLVRLLINQPPHADQHGTLDYELAVAWEAWTEVVRLGRTPPVYAAAAPPLLVGLVFWVKRPAWPRSPMHPAGSAGLGAQEKAVLDALDGIMWPDDTRPAGVYRQARWATKDHPPGVEVLVTDEVPDDVA